MKGNLLFLQTAHYQTDDRVYYHQTQTLRDAGYNVSIVSSLSQTTLTFRQKYRWLIEQTVAQKYDVIICDTPFALVTARHNKTAQLVYDVTEWYPSKKNLHHTHGMKKWVTFIGLLIISYIVGWITDQFIFGEPYKGRPFRILFPWKKYLLLPYYPSVDYLPPITPVPLQEPIIFFYAGLANEDKGFPRVLRVAQECCMRHKDKRFILQLVLTSDSNYPLPKLPNLTYQIEDTLSFTDFCKKIQEPHFCLDLRTIDWENNHCLPIKIFYYMACAKVTIYSDLKALRSIHSGGLFVNPDNYEKICNYIDIFLLQPETYGAVARQSQHLFLERYNWQKIAPQFISFIGDIISHTTASRNHESLS